MSRDPIVTMTPNEIWKLYDFSTKNKGNVVMKITFTPFGEFKEIRKQKGAFRKNAKFVDITEIDAL